MGGQRSISWEGKRVIYRTAEGYFMGRQRSISWEGKRSISWEGRAVFHGKAKE
jgi:hypothetical protein